MVILLSLGKATQPCPSPSAQTLLHLCPQEVPPPLQDLSLRTCTLEEAGALPPSQRGSAT